MRRFATAVSAARSLRTDRRARAINHVQLQRDRAPQLENDAPGWRFEVMPGMHPVPVRRENRLRRHICLYLVTNSGQGHASSRIRRIQRVVSREHFHGASEAIY